MFKAGDTVGHVNKKSMVGTVLSTRTIAQYEDGAPVMAVKVEWNQELYMGNRFGEHPHWAITHVAK